MREPDTKWNPLLLVLRGCGWGAVGGAAFGVLVAIPTVVLLALAGGTGSTGGIAELLAFVTLAGLVAGVVGTVVGAALGLAGGLALALSGPRAVQRMYRARLITGGTAAAIPLAKVHFFSQASGLQGGYAGAAILAILGACAAVLLTPLVVHGMSDRRKRPERLAGAHEPAAASAGSDLSGTGAQEPRWQIVGRGMSWGVIAGTALGALCWTALRLGGDGFASMAMVWLALGGAVLGAVLGFMGGLVVPLNADKDGRSSARLG
jgi:hypothetical protein